MVEAKASISTCACFPHNEGKIPTWRTLQAYWPCLPIFCGQYFFIKLEKVSQNKTDENDILETYLKTQAGIQI